MPNGHCGKASEPRPTIPGSTSNSAASITSTAMTSRARLLPNDGMRYMYDCGRNADAWRIARTLEKYDAKLGAVLLAEIAATER